MPGKIVSSGPLIRWRQVQLGAWETSTTSIETSGDQQALLECVKGDF